MKILVTGATGFIGQNLIKHLLNQDHSLVLLVRHNSDISILDNRASLFYYSDEINNLITLFQKELFDGVIHLASLFLATHQSHNIPNLIHSNIQLGTELLEACKLSKTSWFLNTGTFWQHYENEVYNPVNLYAATKQAFEDIAKYYTETSDLIFTTLNLNDTFGPNDTRNKVFNLWYQLTQTGATLQMSPGEQIIDICYIEDVINAYEILINHLKMNPNDVKNKKFAIHSNERMSLKKLSKVFENTIGIPLNIEWGKRSYREREVMIPWKDTQPLPGWKPKYSLIEAIQKTIGTMK
ncbi:MAG: NAD(P)-dependent oxidoreductase [Sulfuricurvum sp.]|nr:NAD(P)-dependent oxidoreductase [Sulfuricurvum sp.]